MVTAWTEQKKKKHPPPVHHLTSSERGHRSPQYIMADAKAELPVVLLLGDKAHGQRLLEALSDETREGLSGVGVIKNKYYTARVQYQLVPADAPEAVDQIAAAEAVVLLWDVKEPEVWRGIKALFPSHDDAEEDGPDRVQLCLAVETEQGAVELTDEAREWCVDQGFEFLSCPLEDQDLHMLKQRCQQPANRSSLLDEDAENSVLRLREALECHSSWPGLVPAKLTSEPSVAPALAATSEPAVETADPKKSGYTSLPDAPVAPKKAPVGVEKLHDRMQDEDFADVDEFEKFAQEMKEIRALSDHGARRDRACDLALRLAASLGVDSDSD
ncbi:unnamed protein product [Durusdinium trenchii]|uniref:Alpha-and gamma-adaptin-binding protein p34 n=1 Tax=Durusdinium trenchii TaxID=1381693 RepID=A0ABP0SFT4_9DINO